MNIRLPHKHMSKTLNSLYEAIKGLKLNVMQTTQKTIKFGTQLPNGIINFLVGAPFYIPDTDIQFEWTIDEETIGLDGNINLAINEIKKYVFMMGGPDAYASVMDTKLVFITNSRKTEPAAICHSHFGKLPWIRFEGNFTDKAKYAICKAMGSYIQAIRYWWRINE